LRLCARPPVAEEGPEPLTEVEVAAPAGCGATAIPNAARPAAAPILTACRASVRSLVIASSSCGLGDRARARLPGGTVRWSLGCGPIRSHAGPRRPAHGGGARAERAQPAADAALRRPPQH